MSRFFITLLCLFSISLASAQINELGLYAGGSNFMGDVGNSTFVKPNEFAFGAIYKWNQSTRHAWRFSFTHATLTADDSNSNEPAKQARDYDFKNSINELSAGLEFNFFDFNLHDLDNKTTPYVYSGLNYITYDGLYKNEDNKLVKGSDRGSLAIPMAVGIKSRIASRLVLALEVKFNYTFTDDIDGSAPKPGKQEHNTFGNLNSNDWYTLTGLSLTYTFGKNPCYCLK